MTETMRAVQVGSKGGDFELVERPVPTPGPGEALVRVEACGVCHSDMFAKEGLYPGVTFPVVPGHEVAGRGGRARGGRAGLVRGQAGRRRLVRRQLRLVHAVPSRSADRLPEHGHPRGVDGRRLRRDVVVPASALAAIPDELDAADAAPLLCAGITTFNALRHSSARAGDLVAVLGVGGLGHLGVQYAARMGFDTVAIARGTGKESLARELGARHYIDSSASDRPRSWPGWAARRTSSPPSPTGTRWPRRSGAPGSTAR